MDDLLNIPTPLLSLLNTSEVFVFRIERISKKPGTRSIITNLEKVQLNDELDVNGKRYILTGNVVFDDITLSTLYADVFDFGARKFYRHHYLTVLQADQPSAGIYLHNRMNIKDTHSILAFYSKLVCQIFFSMI